MTIYNQFNAPSASSDGSGMYVKRARIDFWKQNVASGDDLRILDIPAGTIILSAYYKVRDGGDTATIDIGYSQNDASIKSNLAVQTKTNWTIATAPVLNGDAFKEYITDGYIWVNADAAISGGLIDLMFLCVQTTDKVIDDAVINNT